MARRSIQQLALLSGEDTTDELTNKHAEARELRLSFWLLLIPCASAASALVHTPDRLSWVSFAVVSAFSVFLALLLATYQKPFASLIALQVFIAGATWMSAAFADELSLTFASMVAPLNEELPDRVGTVQAFMFLTAALCVLPSALGMGAVFPASLRAWTSGGSKVAQDVGVVYAGNTVGSILGAWLPGFVLMPLLGMQQTLYVGIAFSLLTACVLACLSLIYSPASARGRRPATLTAATLPWLIALVAFAALRPERLLGWDISRMTLGAFRISLARDVLDEETWGAPDLVYYRDGLSTTVTVERWGRHLSLKNNGKVDASNGDDMPTQIMVAALPLLLHAPHTQPLDAAIIGFGSGVTVGAALSFPVHSVEVIELESATVDASRFFADVNHLHYVLKDFPYVVEPRLRVIADDGRNYLAATRQRYDVIISEPSNPWLTGVSDLFTSDHFARAKRRLKPGGVYCQWAQLYELSPQNVQTLYHTFAQNFRYVIAFSAEDQSSDTILVGSDEPLPLNFDRIEERLADPRVKKELARAHGLVADFAAKPREDLSGNGLHVHQSLWSRSRNRFWSDGLSAEAMAYLGGLLASLCELAAIGSPSEDAYLRREVGSFCPTVVSWDGDNRTVAIRALADSEAATRLEQRDAAADANPYLVFAGQVHAGLDGIDHDADPGERTTGDAYARDDLPRVPAELGQSLALLEESDLAVRILGSDVHQSFCAALEARVRSTVR